MILVAMPPKRSWPARGGPIKYELSGSPGRWPGWRVCGQSRTMCCRYPGCEKDRGGKAEPLWNLNCSGIRRIGQAACQAQYAEAAILERMAHALAVHVQWTIGSHGRICAPWRVRFGIHCGNNKGHGEQQSEKRRENSSPPAPQRLPQDPTHETQYACFVRARNGGATHRSHMVARRICEKLRLALWHAPAQPSIGSPCGLC